MPSLSQSVAADPTSAVARGSRAALLAVLVLLLQGCALGYYWQAASGHLDVMRRAQPIDRLLEAPGTDEALAERLRTVREVRRFAVDELGLPDNASYTRYADLQRSAVVYNVVAVPEFSLEPRQWCFPVAGCVPYRGYFSRERADTKAGALLARGYDTHVGGVTAYSTLGRFNDPVLNTMLDRGVTATAAVIFHELAHQQLYVADDASFNEAYAVAVEQHGTRRWLASRGDTAALTAYEQLLSRQEALTDLIRAQRERLEALYASSLPPAQMRARKAEAFAQMRDDYVRVRAGWDDGPHFDGWFNRPLNNSHLLAVATYRDLVPGFEALLARSGDIVHFHEAARELADKPVGERHARLHALAAKRDGSARSGAPARALAED